MTNNVKETLTQINHVSRQLLSRIQYMQTILQENPHTQAQTQTQGNSSTKTQKKDNEDELTELMSNRQCLITHLFEQYSAEEIKVEHLLINEMTTLDTELSIKSQVCKNTLAEQVIKLKKSKKVTNSYKKY